MDYLYITGLFDLFKLINTYSFGAFGVFFIVGFGLILYSHNKKVGLPNPLFFSMFFVTLLSIMALSIQIIPEWFFKLLIGIFIIVTTNTFWKKIREWNI